MSFAECNGSLFCAAKGRIYERVNGAVPAWREVYQFPAKMRVNNSGFRGLWTAIPDPANPKHQLLMMGREGGWWNNINSESRYWSNDNGPQYRCISGEGVAWTLGKGSTICDSCL